MQFRFTHIEPVSNMNYRLLSCLESGETARVLAIAFFFDTHQMARILVHQLHPALLDERILTSLQIKDEHMKIKKGASQLPSNRFCNALRETHSQRTRNK